MRLPLKSSMECLSKTEFGPQLQVKRKLRREQVLHGKRAVRQKQKNPRRNVATRLSQKFDAALTSPGAMSQQTVSKLRSGRGSDGMAAHLQISIQAGGPIEPRSEAGSSICVCCTLFVDKQCSGK